MACFETENEAVILIWACTWTILFNQDKRQQWPTKTLIEEDVMLMTKQTTI